MSPHDEAITRWRLILGRRAERVNPAFRLSDSGSDDSEGTPLQTALPAGMSLAQIDRALSFVYDGGERFGGTGDTQPYISQWLEQMRALFNHSTLAMVQHDAFERTGLAELLLQPEVMPQLQPDVQLVATILSLKDQIPDTVKQAARDLVRSVVDELRHKLELQVRPAVFGALQRNRYAPIRSARNLDWQRTIKSNLKNYLPDRKVIIPERLYFWANEKRFRDWQIIILVDQSGSIANSAVHSSIMATIFASLNVLNTRLVAFDTSIADLTPYLNNDPVELLFTLQLGGGTDIAQAVEYGAGLVERPEKCILVLIQVQGSKPYTVRIEFHNGAPKAKCTCPAARFSKFCKHAIAVLIMWAQSPVQFIYGQQTLAEEPPTTKPRGAKRATKATVERSDLQTQSIQQTLKLAQELAERGLTGVQPAFLEQLRTIAENLQSLKTRRLKQAVDHLAQIIETARESAVSEEQFTRALLRLWLTTRAVEEHFAQRRTLPQEQLEEMLGRTWRDTDLQPRENLRLMELAYENIVIQTGFRLDISHLIELNTGELLREMKITPLSAPPAAQGMKPARPKPFLATRVGVHPGYAPKRIKIYDALPLHDELATLVPQTLAHAHTEWRSLISHYLERLLDPFAPRELPCLLHYQHIVWQDNTLWLADTQGMLLQLNVMPAHLETLREAEQQDQQIQQEHPGMIRAESDVYSSVCWEHALLRHRWLALFGYLEGEDRLWFRPIGGLHEHGVAPLIFQLQRR